MCVHIRSSVPKRFAKFGWKTRTFCHKKSGKSDCQTRVRLTIAVCMCRDPLWQNTSALDLGGKLVTYFMRDGTKPYRP